MEKFQSMNEVPFFSFAKAPLSLREEWTAAISETLASNKFILGESVFEFERAWAEKIGVPFGVGVANGLDGLVLALKSLGVGEGDLVGVPSHTFIGTITAIVLVGAKPFCIDVDENGLLDIDKVLDIPAKISAIIPVHMHGRMVDMFRLTEWARMNSVFVIEDGSQSHFAQQNGKMAGAFGDVSVFSLYPSKNLGALGDAGIVTTNNSALEKKLRLLANYGSHSSDKYHHFVFGHNSRLDSIQASVLLRNLEYLTEWNQKRSDLAKIYTMLLGELDQIEVMGKSIESVWHHYPILTENRIGLRKFLFESKIQTEIHYPRLAAYEYYDISGVKKVVHPVGERISNTILSLPISQWHTESEIEYVSSKIIEFFNVQSDSVLKASN
jgi:dTDP-4-amino-4,6-dideoxygalactose transaminase